MRKDPLRNCRCCDGTGAETPARVNNPPGKSTLDYRIGRHADYLAAMQARLSSSEAPALAALTTREASDLSLAVTDALACSLDVLGFYTERYTQEHYLRSATERLSVREMARLIGYRLKPGVAAATQLAFTLQDSPGGATEPITIPVGTRVQSVPGQDEQAQTFETIAEVPARPQWNALPVQHDEQRIPAFGDTSLWLQGTDTRLETGDLLLIVGDEHLAHPANERWDVRVLTEVQPYPDRDLTHVRWEQGLGHSRPFVLPAGEGVRIYTFRSRATAFGANAPDWRALSDESKASYIGLLDGSGNSYPAGLTAADHQQWPEFTVRAPVYPERHHGESIAASAFLPATIAEVADAATSAAQATATQALHSAAAAGSGVVAAGSQMASNAFNVARNSAEAMNQVAQLAANEVTTRVHTMLTAVQDSEGQNLADTIGNLVSNLPGIADDVLSIDAPSVAIDTAEALDPTAALESLGNDAAEVGERARDAASATLSAEASSAVAALVSAAVAIARNLPATVAPQTPDALAAVVRHFAGLGVIRAGGTPPVALSASDSYAQIEAQLPPGLQNAFEIGNDLLSLAEDTETLLNAPREGALSAYQMVVSQVDRALLGTLSNGSTRRPALVRSNDRIDITPLNESVVAGGWALLSVPNSTELYRITEASSASRAEYLLTGQTTRLRLSGELPEGRLPAEFESAVRSLAVHVDSEQLQLARTPLASPLYGDRITLQGLVEGLLPGQPLALYGKRPRVVVTGNNDALTWTSSDGETRLLDVGDSLLLLKPPERLIQLPALSLNPLFGGQRASIVRRPARNRLRSVAVQMTPAAFAAAIGQHTTTLRLTLEDSDGASGQVELRGSDIALAEPWDDDPEVAEIVFLADASDAVTQSRTRSTLQLARAMRHCYYRIGTRLNANCAPASHGESVETLLGSGDGSTANQHFTLNQAPLTHVSADTPSGSASTLQIRINDVLWQEQASLYQAPPDARVYHTRLDDDGLASIEFGDGIEGARLPSGESNVRARYRKGTGVAGNVGAGKLTTLLSRPLGVAEVSNPDAATGGEDGETLDRARRNAPLTVLTLERAVSISDYADFARAFAGIDKALALWIPAGPARGVMLSIAGIDGATVAESSATYRHLHDALRRYGDPLLPLRLINYRDVRFRCRLSIKIHADHPGEAVLAAVNTALSEHFAFAQRHFGQTVSVDEVAAVAQGVSGVAAVHVAQLYRLSEPATLQARLFASLPVASLTALPKAAELLTLSDDPIELEMLP